jgi:hypothetical protein
MAGVAKAVEAKAKPMTSFRIILPLKRDLATECAFSLSSLAGWRKRTLPQTVARMSLFELNGP